MIPHSSAGGQPWGHPMRPLNAGPGRVDLAQMSSQYDPSSVTSQPPLPPSQPQTRQSAVVDLTNNGYDPNDKEPPPKRPRLDISGASKIGDAGSSAKGADARSTPASASSRPQLSWRGRPMWSFQAVMSEIPGSATGSRPTSPPPFPPQPWSNTPLNRLDGCSRSREASPDKKVQTIPFRIVTPSVAPAIKGEKVADFTPWTGNHPEDVLNEQAAKQGYYSRTQVSQNESNTARPALYGQLKHRTGLQMLSTVFSAALEKRQHHNTVHAPSSFKPPPRVTLTDNKREAWLRDLANPSVPLRRLSRTIPHGIRGKVLLDQCLGKWIPVARAVWLAKCVGANEIRAFKRKGTSGALAVGLEAKWVRDWTTNVQQFLETVFSAPKSSDWKPRMTYAIGLTARLFFENLLDHDHFIEWFLSSFEAASIGTVPVWLMMLGIYWSSITRYRRRGRRLAELLLEKLRQATQAKREPLKPLIDRLSRFIKKLVQEHTSSLLLPNSWEKYKSQVMSCLDLTDNVDRALLQNLTERNARVQKPHHTKQTPQRSPNQCIIRLLDSILSEYDINAVSSACLVAVEDRAVLVSKLLEWLSTPFRHGIYRVYAGARLLRKWKAAGVDVDDHILNFLTRAGRNQKLNMENVYHTISELVRSQTFSVGRYLQWLMAKDVTSHASSYRQSMPDLHIDIALIAQLPVSRLPEHVGNLRSTLLARIGFSAADEVNMLANIKQLISRRLPGIFDMDSHNEMTTDSLSLKLTWAVKAEIGQWLRRGVVEHTREVTASTTRSSILVGVHSVSILTPDEFQIVRDILETFEDVSMLADVLKCASSSRNSVVLASVADTTNYHFDSLCMIGATSDLFRKLVDAYTIIKRYNPPSLDLMFSLIELGLRIPHECNTVLILRQDLSRIGNKAVLAASSPVSDHIPDSFGNTDPLFREKLDHLLLSGNLMDEPTLDTIFNTLTKQLESQLSKGKLSANDICQYLAQLRSFQPKHFDGILIRWVCTHLRSSDRSTLLNIIPSLIGVGCVTITSFLSLVRRLSYSTTPLPNAEDLPADLVDTLLSVPTEDRYLDLFSPPAEDRYSDLVSYRFYLSQQEFLAKSFDEVLSIVCDAASSLDIGDVRKRNDREASLVTLLRELLVRNPGCVEQSCMKKLVDQYPNAIGPLRKALDSLLGVDHQKDASSVISQVEKLASTTDDLSLPFCQLKLQILFHQDSDNEDRNNIADAVFKTVVANSRAHNFHWVDLVALMSPDAVRQIRERAEREFFSIPVLEESSINSLATPHSSGSLETAKLYLTIIEELAGSTQDAATSAVVSALVDKMDGLLQKILTMQGDDRTGGTPSPARSNFDRSLAFWFSALLRMVVIHRASFMLPSGLKVNASHEPSRLLVSIFCIALSRLPADVLRLFPGADYFPRAGSPKDYRPCPGILLQTHALDVAASLIDVFPDETRYQCSRFLREKCPTLGLQSDARFLYLLGPMGDFTMSHLQSAAAPSPAAGSTPTPNLPAPAHSSQSTTTHSGAHVGEGLNFTANRLRLQQRGRTVGPYPNRPWELLEDAAPFVGVNDTAVNLGYFDARRIRL
ncbi:uncharacterized protein N7503_007422 [Penicillium pulvis]|uniref:uncharacterized protein n=1 Tax=Penicillium pulvis TaxID=1562058 RepID=UPI002546B9D0|nr:uncharacterized protein N7503_007422 [Penicillium pulvis]KAJ5798126.1 hypothetical protein N7503_007422 [Penicillium pulvis]